jgi:phospholipid transport system transporter-binding protein
MAEANPMISLDALTFETANAALEQGCAAIGAGETVFDLGGVRAADSSGVALLLAWQRRARDAGHKAHVYQCAGQYRCVDAAVRAGWVAGTVVIDVGAGKS